jgi:acyl-coenzyme A thioesterase PaaI-like protein
LIIASRTLRQPDYNAAMSASDDMERLRSTLTLMNGVIPHGRDLGFRLADFGPGWASLAMDWREGLGGEGEGLPNGVVTALLDQVCGLAVQAALPTYSPIATLDLRIDFLRPPRPGAGLVARADCYRRGGHIAFVRAVAHDGDPGDPVAAAQSAFMLETAAGPSGANR